MSSKKLVFQNFKLYAVTDLKSEDPEVLKKIDAAYRGGADIVQLRSKCLSDGELYRIGLRIRKLADRYRKLFFINDRTDLALAVCADGIHVGQEDLPVKVIRALALGAGQRLLVGKSTHSIGEALRAQKDGADYIGVGPVFETPTKPGRQAVGLELVRLVSSKIKIPWVAIGGIDEKNIGDVLRAGAKRIAVVRAVFAAERVQDATRQLRRQITDYEHD